MQHDQRKNRQLIRKNNPIKPNKIKSLRFLKYKIKIKEIIEI